MEVIDLLIPGSMHTSFCVTGVLADLALSVVRDGNA
jgi:hypothetical protein